MKMLTVQAMAPDQKSINPMPTSRPVARQVGSSATRQQSTMISIRIQ